MQLFSNRKLNGLYNLMLKSGSVRIALIYIIISLAWIFFSDRALYLFKNNLSESSFEFVNSAKGFFFVISTGVLLFFLIRASNRQIINSKNEYRILYEGNPSPMWIYNPETLNFISVNDAAVVAYGYSKQEFLKMSIKDIRPKEGVIRLLQVLNHGKFQKSGVWSHLKKDGTTFFVDVSSHTIRFGGKDMVMVLARDCTEIIGHQDMLKQANFNLADEKKRLIDIQELSKIAAWDYFIEDRKLILSDEVYRIFNVDKTQIDADYDMFLKTIHHEDLNRFLGSARVTMATGRDLDIVHRFYLKKNDIRFIRQLGKLETRDGKPYKIRGTMQDITEIKRIQQEINLINSENKKLDNIITKINNMVVIVDTESRITWVNKAYTDFTGYKLDDIIGQKPSSFMTGPDNVNQLQDIDTAEQRREVFSIDTINYTKNNQPYWVNIEFTPMFDEETFIGYITVHNDITIRKEKEDEITKQNTVLRDIAWLSSHEIRRPAASILGLMNLIKDTDDMEEKDEYLDLLNDCTLQLDQIIHQINNTINEKLPQG